MAGVVDLAKDTIGPGEKVEEGRAALDPFVDALEAHLGDLRLALEGSASAREAAPHVGAAQAARDAARPVVSEARSEEEVAAARRHLEDGLRAAHRAWGVVEGRGAPDPRAPLLDGLCAFDPRHGRAVEALAVTTRKDAADVPVCRGCAVLIGKGVTPEVRKTTKGGCDAAYYDGPGWDTAGFALLPAFGLLDGGSFLADVFGSQGDDGDCGWGDGDGGGDGGGGDGGGGGD